MACVDEVRLNDVGTRFNFTIKECIDDVLTVVDISGADSIEIYFTKPEVDGVPGAVIPKIGVISSGGTDGKCHYITVTDDMDVEGSWLVQGKAIMTPGVSEFGSKIEDFEVVANTYD